jgi:hypothetical protein
MPVRTPDPFPWPDDEICVQFGRTSYYAHKLEREFKLFLLAAHISGRIPISYDEADFRTLETFLYAQSLGGLIHILKAGGGLTDKTLKNQLYRALNARNELAHTALENHDPMHYHMAHRDALIRRLGELRFRIGIPYLMIREFRKIAEEEIGITEEELQAKLREVDDENA